MLFDRRDALQRVVDLFVEAGDVLESLREVSEVATDRFQLVFDARYLFGHSRDVAFELLPKCRYVVLGRHTRDHVREHFADFFERRLFAM